MLGVPWKTDGAAELDSCTPLEWLALQGCNITRDDVIAQGLNQAYHSCHLTPRLTDHQVDISDPTILPPAFYLSVPLPSAAQITSSHFMPGHLGKFQRTRDILAFLCSLVAAVALR